MNATGASFRWANVFSGALTIGSSWAFAMPSPNARWDVGITGALTLVAALAVVALGQRRWTASAVVVEMFAGIWLLLSTTFVHGDHVAVWSNIVLGLFTTGAACVTYERVVLGRARTG